MVESLCKYSALKRDYFAAINKLSGVKGLLRTLIGLQTWYLERGLMVSSTDYINAHVFAFSEAIEKANKVKTKSDLINELNVLKKSWVGADSTRLERGEAHALIDPPIRNIRNWRHNGLNAISLFSGAMGLDIGFMAAGFDLRLTNDIDPKCKGAAEVNVPDIPFINQDIDLIGTDELLLQSSIDRGHVDVLIGGPPCQPFSPAGKRAGLSDPRASPLKYFIKAIKEIQPRVFVMEEVPGILSSRLKHYPISVRGARKPTPEEEKGSAFKVILGMLKSTGYNFTYSKVNAADYGSPQARERVVFIGMKDGEPTLPPPTYSNDPDSKRTPWNSLWEAIVDLYSSQDDFIGISDRVRGFMKYVGPGGNWRDLPENMVKEAMGGAYYAGGGKMGFYRRLAWDEPSPTVVTTPSQKGTFFVHPEVNRQLSVREFARIQGFPSDWYLAGTMADRYRLIGNAVPVHLSYAVAKHVLGLLEGKLVRNKTGVYSYE